MNKTVMIDYTNYRGERKQRQILPLRFYYGSTQHHIPQQYLCEAMDLEKGEVRTFALSNIHSWRQTTNECAANH